MATSNLGRVQGGGFFGSSATSTTTIPKTMVFTTTKNISPLVGDTIVNANGILCLITTILDATYIVQAYGSIKGAKGDKGDMTDSLSVYPVGAVYMSFSNKSPASLFGGTWIQITGVFLYCANGTGTGGSNSVKLTEANIPAMDLSVSVKAGGGYKTLQASQSAGGWDGGYFLLQSSGYHLAGEGDDTVGLLYARKTGGATTFNNMPAYQEVYAWRRTQ